MSIATAIQAIRDAGFKIEAEGDYIAIEAFDLLTDEQVDWLKAHKPDILEELRSPGAILDANQPGNDIEPANNPQSLVVEAWTPAGILMLVEASSVEHAQWIERMNPPPIPARAVRCCECTHASVTAGIARCAVGVESGLPIAGFWATDRHLCERFVNREERL